MLPNGNARRSRYLFFAFNYRRGFTLEEALEIAYSEDLDVANIYIEPPDTSQLTDEDSAEEDEGGLLDNLSSNQLRAPAEMEIISKDDEESDSSDSTPVPNPECSKIDFADIVWVNGDLVFTKKDFPIPDYEHFKCLTPTECFEQFFDEEIIDLLVSESCKYSKFKNCTNFSVTSSEMKCFLAVLILSGYNILPGKKFYWDSSTDMGNQLVKNSIRRDRFISILRYFHCADNSKIDLSDKFFKLRPLMDKLRNNFLKHFVPEEELNLDESMVKYFGRHPCKQFIRGKPIRFGYKIWSLNTKSGYLINFVPYQGNDKRISTEYQNIFGKCAAPLLMMLNEFEAEKRNLRYSLYFDNLFTSIHLLSHLKKLGYSATGTIRDNRIPKNCPLPTKNQMKKKSRGHSSSALDTTNGIIVMRWNDNNIVSVASTAYGVHPQNNVKRFSQSEKKTIQVPRPLAIGRYNASMGGTDLMDENISRHRVGIRGKKWWWNLFTWLLDAALQNAWVLYKQSGNKITFLEFRREIVKTYLTNFGTLPKQGGRPSISLSSRSSSRVGDDIRFDGTGHFLTKTENGKKIRCAGEDCKSIMRTFCSKCKVGLCVKCNSNFHTQI